MKQVKRIDNTRRDFVKRGTAVAAAGMGASQAKAQTREALALNGGSKAVTIGAEVQKQVFKWPRYEDEEKQAVFDLMESNNWYAEIPAFEKELREYLKVPYVKAHSSGTCSLMSMFFALDLPPGSEILAPSYTAWATTAPLHLFGYVPAFVDINPRTMTFDLDSAKKRLNSRTKGVLPMHSFGNPCDMDQICDFAKARGPIVLEDAAQAQGASLQGKPVGTWGAMGMFSHQSSKILPAIEGGTGVYHKREHYERATVFGGYELARFFPDDSPYKKYLGTGIGPKFRIHSLGAAIARRQLRKIDRQTALEHAQIKRFTDRIAELPGLSVPYTRPDAKRVYWGSQVLFVDEKKVGCPKDVLMKALRAEGVNIGDGAYDEQHKYKLYSEPKWWHHPVVIPEDLYGTAQVNRQALKIPVFRTEAPELIAQYVKAFEKVWANRTRLNQSA
jgi:dTDP-4-amino-4,6-dideoxygalactose transaminase